MNARLSERQKIEERYYDGKCGSSIVEFEKHNFRSTCYSKFFYQSIPDVKGLNILDFGCGNGWLGIKFAMMGGEVWGIDISGEAINRANEYAINKGLSKGIHFSKMAAENLTFPDNFFDLVVGIAILHHTDIKMSIEGLFRVLKSCGRAIFIEPLNENILLKVWRKCTPWRRSPIEKALVHKDLQMIRAGFPLSKYNYFVLTSTLTHGLLILFPYNKLLLFFNSLLERLDALLLGKVPNLGKYCAVVVLDLKKSNN